MQQKKIMNKMTQTKKSIWTATMVTSKTVFSGEDPSISAGGFCGNFSVFNNAINFSDNEKGEITGDENLDIGNEDSKKEGDNEHSDPSSNLVD